jgi:hypothetical protein
LAALAHALGQVQFFVGNGKAAAAVGCGVAVGVVLVGGTSVDAEQLVAVVGVAVGSSDASSIKCVPTKFFQKNISTL